MPFCDSHHGDDFNNHLRIYHPGESHISELPESSQTFGWKYSDEAKQNDHWLGGNWKLRHKERLFTHTEEEKRTKNESS